MRSEGALLNVILRVATLAARTALLVVLVQFLSPSEVGTFGLFTATVAYALYGAGLDFYTYSTREIISGPAEARAWKLKSHATFSLALYGLISPLLLLIFVLGALPWDFVVWFFLLLALELGAQEFDRIFIAFSMNFVASVVMFMRLGSWSVLLGIVFYFWPESRHVTTVLALWSCGAGAACLFGVTRLRAMGLQGWDAAVDLRWLWRGVKICVPLLVGTLALQALSTFDRYWVSALVGSSVLGAYVLFIGVAVALNSVLSAGVFNFQYPKLVLRASRKEADAFRSLIISMIRLVTLVGLAFSVSSYIFLTWFVGQLSNNVYADYLYLYPWLVASAFLYNVGLIPHYALYAHRHDHSLVLSQWSALGVFVVIVLCTRGLRPDLAVPWALVAANFAMLAWKWTAYCRLLPRAYVVPEFAAGGSRPEVGPDGTLSR